MKNYVPSFYEFLNEAVNQTNWIKAVEKEFGKNSKPVYDKKENTIYFEWDSSDMELNVQNPKAPYFEFKINLKSSNEGEICWNDTCSKITVKNFSNDFDSFIESIQG